MKKTLIICAVAACLAGCAEQHREQCGVAYEPAPTTCGCSTCTQSTCNTCMQQIQPIVHQQPKTIVVMLPPAPQPVIEPEIIYEPQHRCGCRKCGCSKNN